MSDIFISYARKDIEHARRLAEVLEAQGWTVWWDRTIPAGKSFSEVINKALSEARCIVVLWSEAAITSDWVLEEAEDGRQRGILVPVFVEQVTPPRGFRRIQAEDMATWDGSQASPTFLKLVDDISIILGPPSMREGADRAGEEVAPQVEVGRGKVEEEPPRPPEVSEAGEELEASTERVARRIPQRFDIELAIVVGVGILILVLAGKWYISYLDRLKSAEREIRPQIDYIASQISKLREKAGEAVNQQQLQELVRQRDSIREKFLELEDHAASVGLSYELEDLQYDLEYLDATFADMGNRLAIVAPPKAFTNSIGMNFVLIQSGTFMMGSPTNELKRNNDELQRRVTISKPFYLQTTEVTQGQWKSVIGDNPSDFKDCGDDCPVETVSWEDAQKFIRQLNDKERTDKYRLPTEAEWEYACRAGSNKAFCFGNSTGQLGGYAWYYKNSKVQIHPVGQKKPNAWGLYDMHGNVWEWCQDWYGSYSAHDFVDPEGPSDGEYRVLRSGSFHVNVRYLRCASRFRINPHFWDRHVGFRVVSSP